MFSDPDNDLPFAALGRLVSACVKATACELFGLRVGARRTMTSLGLTGLVSMHASTVREALQIISNSIQTTNTGVATTLEVRGQIASFLYVVTRAEYRKLGPNRRRRDRGDRQRHAPALWSVWQPNRVRLTRDPPRDRAPFARFFRVPIEFGALTPGVIFDAAALDWPVRDRDPDYAKILAPLLEDAVADAEGDFVAAVRSALRTRIGAGSLTRDSVCRALGLNARTLAHRLEAFGVTFSGLADEVRFDAAQTLLLKDRRVGEIAAELGFAEPGAFIRAFKSWSGTTPGRWRAARK